MKLKIENVDTGEKVLINSHKELFLFTLKQVGLPFRSDADDTITFLDSFGDNCGIQFENKEAKQ